ncbi:hypothetical protein TorRG33x02_182440, partial [Trema orientale]
MDIELDTELRQIDEFPDEEISSSSRNDETKMNTDEKFAMTKQKLWISKME